MLNVLKGAFDRFAGRGAAAVTIPAMDGPLRPNTLLEELRRFLDVNCPDNLVHRDGTTLFSSGPCVYELDPEAGSHQLRAAFDQTITALAIAPDGTIAVGLNNGGVQFVGGPRALAPIEMVEGERLSCPTALAFGDSEQLFLCRGSARFRPSEWQKSLMTRDFSGSVWRVNLPERSAACIGRKLGYPYGVSPVDHSGSVIISESWRHRLLRHSATQANRPETVLDNLPGYPARQSGGLSGRSWLAVFAPRSQLMEFVLKEAVYRETMVSEIEDPNLWIGPALSSGNTFLEPLQGGAVKQMGILKPWAPARSYGLVIQLSAEFLPVSSFHSRADGRNHGVTSCVELAGGRLLSASAGGNCILSTSLGK